MDSSPADISAPARDPFTTIPVVGRGAAAKGVFWLGAAQGIRVLTGLVSALVLARLLMPYDFGLIATIAPLVALGGLMQDMGLSQATIQRKDMNHAIASGLFWISALLGTLTAGMLAASAPFVASFFGDDRIEPLVVAYAAIPLLGALSSQHGALLTRQCRFKALAALETLAALGGIAITIVAALLKPDAWAIYAGGLGSAALTMVGSWILAGWSPSSPRAGLWSTAALRFGSGVSVFNLMNFVSRNVDNVLIARHLGIAPLGVYDRAYRLLLFPIQQVVAPVARVMIPTLSRLVEEPVRYRAAYAEAVVLLLCATQPAIVLCIVAAPTLIGILLGEGWAEVADVFRWLGVAGLFQVFTGTAGWLFLSQGRARDAALISAFAAVTTILAFVLGLPWGIVGVAGAYAVSDVLVRAPVIWQAMGASGPVGKGDVIGLVLPAAVASGAIGLGLWWGLPAKATFLELALAGVAAQASYLAILAAFPGKRAVLVRNAGFAFARIRRA